MHCVSPWTDSNSVRCAGPFVQGAQHQKQMTIKQHACPDTRNIPQDLSPFTLRASILPNTGHILPTPSNKVEDASGSRRSTSTSPSTSWTASALFAEAGFVVGGAVRAGFPMTVAVQLEGYKQGNVRIVHLWWLGERRGRGLEANGDDVPCGRPCTRMRSDQAWYTGHPWARRTAPARGRRDLGPRGS